MNYHFISGSKKIFRAMVKHRITVSFLVKIFTKLIKRQQENIVKSKNTVKRVQ